MVVVPLLALLCVISVVIGMRHRGNKPAVTHKDVLMYAQALRVILILHGDMYRVEVVEV